MKIENHVDGVEVPIGVLGSDGLTLTFSQEEVWHHSVNNIITLFSYDHYPLFRPLPPPPPPHTHTLHFLLTESHSTL
jgi:hypothetical protein